MKYLKNSWYPAAWDEEINNGEILERTILNERIVLYRSENGVAHAVYGICPHRLAPLKRGKICGEDIQCGYHGLKFGKDGKCNHNPFGQVPKGADIKSYPLVEKYSMLWIWMGDTEKADENLITSFPMLDKENYYVGKGYLKPNCRYELEIENIMDLSHIEYLHPTTLGSGQVSEGLYEATEEGEFIWSKRDVIGEVMTEGLSMAMGIEPGITSDRWIYVRWSAPANMVIFAGAVPTGFPKSEGRETPTMHFFTPETDTSSHYFFSISFPKEMGEIGDQMAQEQIKFLTIPFEEEDMPMLKDQQEIIGSRDLQGLKWVWLKGDAGGSRARKKLADLIELEA